MILGQRNEFWDSKMISKEKDINNKVVELIEIYNFYFGHFFKKKVWLNLHSVQYLFTL